MYITNPEAIHNKIKTNEIIGNYLIKKGIPILSKDRNIFYFANTEMVRDALDNLSIWLKILRLL